MNVSEAIRTRRSIEQFDPEHKISDAEVRELIEAAILSPTAFNIQHWRFLRVSDTQLRQQIKELSWHQPQVTDASLLLFVCMDYKAWQKSPERYWRNTPPEVTESMLRSMEFYGHDSQAERDEGIRSASLAAMTLMLKAKEMGYDSCPMLGFDYNKVAELINLPEDHGICLMLTIGKRTKDAYPRAGQLDLEEVVFSNSF